MGRAIWVLNYKNNPFEFSEMTEKYKIIVIDDNPSLCELVFESLKDDYEIYSFYSGEEALEQMIDVMPHVVLLDIMMPGIDGFEVCRRIRADDRISGIKVLFLSAKSSLEDRLTGYEVKADDFLVKPFDSEELKAKVGVYQILRERASEALQEAVTQKLQTGIADRRIAILLMQHFNKTTEGYLHSVGEAVRKAMGKFESVDIISTPLPDNGGRPTNMHQGFWLRKAKRPDYPTLCEDIKKLGYVGTGKKYNVSDNAIRKWKKHYTSQFEN